MIRVCVIGAGPAGLLAAYGAAQEGARVTVVHPGRWSEISGAQYLHGQIEGLEDHVDHFKIRYRWFGEEEGYRKKVYGDLVGSGGTSWRKFNPIELAWDMKQAYEFLQRWVLQWTTVVQESVTPDKLPGMVAYFDYVFNTAPLKYLAPEGRYFMENVLILNKKNLYGVPLNEIHYYGDRRAGHRSSNINGHVSVEFPFSQIKQIRPRYRHRLKEVVKPLRSEGVELEGVYRLGRYGKWDKDQLVHQAYFEARDILRRGLPWTATLPA